ncbi:MAG: hypothetical protein ACRECN_02635, partial [Methylocella sp.]
MIEPLIDDERIDIAGLSRNREGMMTVHPSRSGLLLLGLVMAGCDSGASLGPVSPAEQQALILSAATTSP